MITRDPDINRVYIIEHEENKGLLHKLKTEGFDPVILPFYKIKSYLKHSDEFSVLVHLQGMGLHINPLRLKNETYTNISLMSRSVDGILLFYGSCGQAFSRIGFDTQL